MKTSGDKKGLRTTGVPAAEELEVSPGYSSPEALAEGPKAVIECTQDIPCNPCELACKKKAIRVGDPITNLPAFFADRCDGCGHCIPVCPGQAVFRVDLAYQKGKATVSLPYEFLPIPKKGDLVRGVNRAGEVVCDGEVLKIQKPKSFDHTTVITISVPIDFGMEVRSIKRLRSPS